MQSLSDDRRPSMTRECDERMWNLAYRLARSGEHRDYQAIEWELHAFGHPQAHQLLDHEQARERLNGLCAEARKIRKCLEHATEKLTGSSDSYSRANNQ